MGKVVLTKVCAYDLQNNSENHLVIKCGSKVQKILGYHRKITGWQEMGKKGKDFTFFTEFDNQIFFNYDLEKTVQVTFEVWDCSQ